MSRKTIANPIAALNVRSGARPVLLALCAAGLCAQMGAASAQENFYAGKTINIVIGSAPGGGYDTYGRLLARHLARHIPGEPNVVPQNMPGAAGMNAAFQAARVAAQDGTTIGAIHPYALMAPVLSPGKLKSDPKTYQYIGSANSDVYVCAMRADAPVKSFSDAFTTEALMGSSSGGASTREFPAILNSVLGTKFKLVSGYKGNRDVMHAIERGEVHGVCGAGWTSLQTAINHLLKDGKVKVIAQEEPNGHPDLNAQNIPKTISFAKTPEQRAILELFYSQQVFGRPYMVGAGVPAGRVALLRKAFMAAMKDPALLAEAKKLHLDIEPIAGDELARLADKLYAAPPEMAAKVKTALGYK